MEHDVQRGGRHGVISTVDCRATVMQNILLSGRAFHKLSVFRELMAVIFFVKIAEDNN